MAAKAAAKAKRAGAKRTAPARPAASRSRAKPLRYRDALRELDAADDEVALEIDGERVALTNLDKVLWPAYPARDLPAYTRRDFVRYLLQAGPYMLPHTIDRPLTLIRMPEGITGRRFVQFHWEQRLPEFVETISIFSEKNRVAEEFLLCNNMPTLLWLAHVGTLELHVWHSRVSTGPDVAGSGTDFTSSAAALQRSVINYPDYLVFDVDPYIYSGHEAKGAQPEFNIDAFEKGKVVAFELKSLLDSMNLTSFVKTSGKTGLHILVPLVRRIAYDGVRAFAETIAKHLVQTHPDLITIDWKTTRRTGKVFLDYAMNVRVKTLSAPYSVRTVPGAPLSMPLTWQALEKAHPLDYTMRTVPALLAKHGDLWSGILEKKQDLEESLRRSAKPEVRSAK
jgi:bifunctional non-homologous end joining protein LigD